MIRASRSRSLIAGLLAIAMSITLSACLGYGQSHPDREAEGQSRARLYSSVADMTADSDAVIVGRVGDSRTVRDVDDTTDFAVSTVTVLGSAKDDARPGDAVAVRQTAPASLRRDDVVLLFLAASGLPGDAADQYYITGDGAGLYKADDPVPADVSADDLAAMPFSRADADSGDTLPDTLRLSDASSPSS